MPDLTAKFSAEDKISDRIESIAQAGMSMVEQFERAGDVASAAFVRKAGLACSVGWSGGAVETSSAD